MTYTAFIAFSCEKTYYLSEFPSADERHDSDVTLNHKPQGLCPTKIVSLVHHFSRTL